jgi:glycosyltransferase involved in cell wall biosynthesis
MDGHRAITDSVDHTALGGGRTNGRRLKVLHVGKFYPPHMGGIETHMEALCGGLCNYVDLRVVVASSDSTATDEMLDGVAVSRVATRLMLASTPLCPGMISKICNDRSDIIHLHFPNPLAVLGYLASRHCGRLVVTYHSDMVRQKVLGPMFEPFLHAALRRSSAIITTSPNYLRSSSVLAQHQERCHVIPLGIPTERFDHCDPKIAEGIRQQYGDRLIVSVGRLVYYKGFEHLIRAMRQVNGTLLIVGEGPLDEPLRALARELGVADRVHFMGKISHDQLVACYHAAKIFVMASVVRSEAFGIAQVEAMAAGLPVVNTQLDSGVPFVSVHEQTGLTVPPGNPGALAEAVNRLLDNPDLRASLGAAAVLRAHQEFSLDAMVSRTMSLYEQVMKHPS